MAKEPPLYESMYILTPDISEEDAERVINALHQYVENSGGEVVSDELFGPRRLAYEIDHYTEGIYRILYFRGDGSTVDELRHEFNLADEVIRGMVVVADPDAMFSATEAVAELEEVAVSAEPVLISELEAESAQEAEVSEEEEGAEEDTVSSEPALISEPEVEPAEEAEVSEEEEGAEEDIVSSEPEPWEPDEAAAEEIPEP